MGIDIDRLVTKEVDEGLLCSICTDILDEPLMIDTCQHAFCRKCIYKWFETNKNCPQDRKAFPENKLVPIPRYMRNHLFALQIKCQNYPKNGNKIGCDVFSSLETIINHQKDCRFDPLNTRITVKIESPMIDMKLLANRSNHSYTYKYKVVMSSWPKSRQNYAIKLAKEALYLCGRQDFSRICVYMKTHLDPQNSKHWHCVAGTDYDCFVTASSDYISLRIDGIFILAFKTL